MLVLPTKVDRGAAVLIVEDIASHKAVLERLCDDLGFADINIHKEGNVDRAVERLPNLGVDIVLFDLADELTPTDASRGRIKLQQWGAHEIPVIVVSAYPNEVRGAAAANVYWVIKKPGENVDDRTRFEAEVRLAILSALSIRAERSGRPSKGDPVKSDSIKPRQVAIPTWWQALSEWWKKPWHVAPPGSLVHIPVPAKVGVIFLLVSLIISGAIFARHLGWPWWGVVGLVILFVLLGVACVAVIGRKK